MQGFVEDYNISAKSLCTEALGVKKGVCPDVHTGGTQDNQIQDFKFQNGVFTVTYRRNLGNFQDPGDVPIVEDGGPTSIVWAMGKLASGSLGGPVEKGRPAPIKMEPTFHHTYPRAHVQLDFGRKATANNCWAFVRLKGSEGTSSRSRGGQQGQDLMDRGAPVISPLRLQEPPVHLDKDGDEANSPAASWKRVRLFDPTLRKFDARLGPSGGPLRGYSAMTGLPSVGKAWYINGYLGPELYLQRGLTYSFVVEGGAVPQNLEHYHPFVITNDPLGGYWRLPEDGSARSSVKIYAGVSYTFRGQPRADATGRLCLWSHGEGADPRLDDNFGSFERFRNSLHLDCQKDLNPAVLTVKPNISWPDVVYYQSFTSPYMGWKINIVEDFSNRYLQNEDRSSTPASATRASVVLAGHLLLCTVILSIRLQLPFPSQP